MIQETNVCLPLYKLKQDIFSKGTSVRAVYKVKFLINLLQFVIEKLLGSST